MSYFINPAVSVRAPSAPTQKKISLDFFPRTLKTSLSATDVPAVTPAPALDQQTAQAELNSAGYSIWSTISVISGALCAYHGYKRNESFWWALGWSIFGSALPPLALPIAFAQGFDEKKKGS